MSSTNCPVVIAHRGASGYLPEHTLPAKTLAFAMGADYLEQDIVASRDDALLVMHDIHLDRTSNVAERFPGRARDDGRFYARDFDLAEIRELVAWERMGADGTAVYPGRFPARTGRFRLHTLHEELELLSSLNNSTGRDVGIYPEIKRPAWHRGEGVDIAPLLLQELANFGYRDERAHAYLQCFDAAETERLRDDLHTRLPLIQLVGENAWRESPTDFEAMLTPDGLQAVARYADGIGPFFEQLYTIEDGNPVSSGVVEMAHDCGLLVHPYTFRSDSLAPGFTGFDAMLEFAVNTLQVDGLFTDFTDSVRRFIDTVACGARPKI